MYLLFGEIYYESNDCCFAFSDLQKALQFVKHVIDNDHDFKAGVKDLSWQTQFKRNQYQWFDVIRLVKVGGNDIILDPSLELIK